MLRTGKRKISMKKAALFSSIYAVVIYVFSLVFAAIAVLPFVRSVL